MSQHPLVHSILVGSVATMFVSVALGAASIKDTPHNLGSGNSLTKTPSGNTPANHSTETSEICVFCHTPHGGDNTAAVPIWNKKLGIGGVSGDRGYKRYGELGSSTFDATETTVGSVTIACLSCHDGTQAIDNMLNKPGSGSYACPGCVGIQLRLGGMQGGDLDPATGKLLLNVVQNLGTDLSNDHPVSMQFGGGGYSVGKLTGPSVDPDFASLQYKTAPITSGLGNLWWIDNSYDRGTLFARDRWDIILYTRNELGALQPFVECGSCHDPHNADNPTFLRIANYPYSAAVAQPSDGRIFTGAKGGPSGLCLTCHTK